MGQAFDWQAAEDAVHAWFAASTGLGASKVIWRNQSAPQPAYPFGSLLVLSGPSRIGGQDEQRDETDGACKNVRITPIVQDSVTYTVRVNGTSFAYVADADATVAEITAGLVAAITAGSEPVEATDNGTDFDLVSTDGNVFTLELVDNGGGASLLSYANNDLGNEVLLRVSGPRTVAVSCQVYTTAGADPANHSRAMMLDAQSALGKPSVIAALKAAGLSVINEGDVVNLDEVIEDKWISRAGLDVTFGLASNLSERTGYIERAAVSSDLGTAPSLELDDEEIGA